MAFKRQRSLRGLLIFPRGVITVTDQCDSPALIFLFKFFKCSTTKNYVVHILQNLCHLSSSVKIKIMGKKIREIRQFVQKCHEQFICENPRSLILCEIEEG